MNINLNSRTKSPDEIKHHKKNINNHFNQSLDLLCSNQSNTRIMFPYLKGTALLTTSDNPFPVANISDSASVSVVYEGNLIGLVFFGLVILSHFQSNLCNIPHNDLSICWTRYKLCFLKRWPLKTGHSFIVAYETIVFLGHVSNVPQVNVFVLAAWK